MTEWVKQGKNLIGVMNKELFSIKGSRQGLAIICDDRAPWEEVLANLHSRMEGKGKEFFAGTSIGVELGSRHLNSQQVAELWSLFEANQISIRELRTARSSEPERTSAANNDDISALPTLVVERNLRSGQNISHRGNVIIIGDVNPGAEVEATGFVMVWGDLRGTVHAGAAGNEKAWVAAQRLQPTQLRIAQYITRAPEEEPQEPEIAEIVDRMIVVRQLRKIHKSF